MLNWTKAQWEAYGRHAITAVGSILATLVTLQIITDAQSAVYLASATTVITAIAGLVGTLLPFYAAWQASRSASPDKQVDQVVKNLESGQTGGEKKQELINAVAEQPEVTEIKVQSPALANAIPSEKVVS